MTLFFKRLVLSVLLIESIFFCVLYCFGPNGMHILSSLRAQKVYILADIENLKRDIVQIKQELEYSQGDFYKEKMARERLQMKKNNEIVFFKT